MYWVIFLSCREYKVGRQSGPGNPELYQVWTKLLSFVEARGLKAQEIFETFGKSTEEEEEQERT